ncbi:CAX-interacting protein 4 [Prunus yedoensis var. nudiflora]|uniref:CAX-interacting protein 4 n=1 Tax=Prunus yedoensis var. nudiflora TaxID=2094558 RepID=A0A314Z3C8_PRUYE|nr:CAX-interacting protein 4 [Prunus yedoensis var. nudiflora]
MRKISALANLTKLIQARKMFKKEEEGDLLRLASDQGFAGFDLRISKCLPQQEGFACPRTIGCIVVLPFKPMVYGRVQLDAENAYASFQGLLALARITGSNADEARGACKRCGRVGHLNFQCRNFLSVKEDKEKDPDTIQADVASELGKLKRKLGRTNGKNVAESEESEDEDEDSESSDSDYDSEIEKIIAQRNGKKAGRKDSTKKNEDSDGDGSDTDSGERKKRGRSKKRSSKRKYNDDSDDSDEGRKKRRKEKRRKRDESSDEDGERRRRHRKSRKEKRRRRSHRYSDDSESDSSEDSHSRKHRSRRSRKAVTPSDSDVDSRVGRGRKRSEKKSRKRHHEDDE